MFVYGTYVLEGEVDAKFSLSDIWNLFQGDSLPNNASNFYRQKWRRGITYKNIRSSTEHRDYQASTRVNDGGWKRCLGRKYRKSPAFAGYHMFAPAGYIERYMEDAVFRFHKTKNYNNFGNIRICLETLSIYTHLKMEMEGFVTLSWLMLWYRWNVAYLQSF